MKSSLLILIILSACTNLPQKNKEKPAPVSFNNQDIQLCHEYQKDVLDDAYKEIMVNGNPTLVFSNNVHEARASFSKLHPELSLIRHKIGLVKGILYSCDEISLKKFDEDYKKLSTCTAMFSEINYFQSLASALNKYPWPIDLRLEGKKIALDYVKFYAEDSYPLLNRLIALSVLYELSLNSVVNKDLHPEIKQIMTEAQAYVEGLKMKLSKENRLTCDGVEIMREELAYSDRVAAKIKQLLTKI